MRGFISDETPRKVYDSRLVNRMFKYAKPYLFYMVLALFFILVLSGIQLLNPYLQKVALDKYIIFNERFIYLDKFEEQQRTDFLDKYQEDIVLVEKDICIANPEIFDITEAVIWEKAGITSAIKVFLVDSLESREKATIIQKYSDKFKTTEKAGMVFITLEDLQEIKEADIRILRAEHLSGVVRVGLLFLLLVIVGAVINFVQIYTLAWFGQQIMKAIRTDLFGHMQRLSLSFFDKNPIGRLVTRATNDVNAINEMFTSVAINLFNDIIKFIGILIILYFLSPKLALILLSTLPIIIISTIFFRIKVRKAYRLVRRKLAEINASLSEHFSGIKTIKHFAREKENIRRFSVLNQEYYDANMTQLTIMAVFRPITSVVQNLGIALLIWYGGKLVLNTSIPLGTLVAFLSYVSMFFQPIAALADKFNIMQSAMAASERIVGILDTEPDIQDKKDAITQESVEGSISFENVWFSYSDKEDDWVLKDISFTVKPGESIALVGETGAGKTTITSLLPRFYDIQKGRIKVDGIDIRDWQKKSLRQKIGIVLQDVFIFATNVAGNISLKDKSITRQSVVEASKIVNAHGFVSKLKDGYDEVMHERGSTISTGQKQLLSFARVLAFDPKILILDEATSNIDTETENLIQDALLKLLKKRTSIIVAHRLSTIKHADRILVLHKGQIVEEGDHQALLAKRGIYYNLYLLQYANQEDDLKHST